jgi:O-acetyl-ADP-ribose deacetylase (regulator of RNase III)
MKYQEIEGDLIKLATQGTFDVITHGCNCFCTMGAGIAPQMALVFECNFFEKEIIFETGVDEDGEPYEHETGNKGDINKLGTIDYEQKYIWFKHPMSKEPVVMNHRTVGQPDTQPIIVVNSYTQYRYGRNHADGVSNPLDYEALTLCMRKINHQFKGKHIGLPKIGAGLAGGDWDRIKKIIQTELRDMKVTVVVYKPE